MTDLVDLLRERLAEPEPPNPAPMPPQVRRIGRFGGYEDIAYIDGGPFGWLHYVNSRKRAYELAAKHPPRSRR